MGCGDHWPLCDGRLLPPFDDRGTLIEWSHRLVAALASVLVSVLAAYTWWTRRDATQDSLTVAGMRDASNVPTGDRPGIAPYVAFGLLLVQVGVGAVTVKLRLPPWTVILHLGTAMLLLATLIVAAQAPRVAPPSRAGRCALALGFVTVLLGGLTANMGAASACLGFPLCNGQIVPTGNELQYVHWTHRLLAYALFAYSLWWAVRARTRRVWALVALVTLQVAVAAVMVLWARPQALQALHVAAGTAVWAGLVVAAL
jgi:heme A synthase